TDEAEAERHGEHDPDVRVERVGPQDGCDHKPGQNHEAAHGRRALLAHQMRLRAVVADRLTLTLAKPQMIDDPGPEQEHEQRAGYHRAAGAKRDVAKYVQNAVQACEAWNGIGKVDQPVKHSISL